MDGLLEIHLLSSSLLTAVVQKCNFEFGFIQYKMPLIILLSGPVDPSGHDSFSLMWCVALLYPLMQVEVISKSLLLSDNLKTFL